MAPPTPRDAPRVPDAVVRSLMREFLNLRRREEAAVGRTPRPSPSRIAITAALLVFCLAAWFGPSLIRPEDPPLSPEHRAAAGRLTILITAARVGDFAATHGRLPNSLADAGLAAPGLGYFRTTATSFELWQGSGASRIDYRSTMSGRTFLGNSLEILSGIQ